MKNHLLKRLLKDYVKSCTITMSISIFLLPDPEIIRFLEMLEEDNHVADMVANKNKKVSSALLAWSRRKTRGVQTIFLCFTMILNVFQVFSEIAARLVSEGADKTWDQCRIKLKNLKSQYRYVKERIPYIDDLDLDNEDVIKQLLTECQAKAISPSSIKHLKFLLRYGERSHTVENLLGG